MLQISDGSCIRSSLLEGLSLPSALPHSPLWSRKVHLRLPWRAVIIEVDLSTCEVEAL